MKKIGGLIIGLLITICVFTQQETLNVNISNPGSTAHLREVRRVINHNDSALFAITDTISIVGDLTVNDSLYLPKLSDLELEFQWLGLTPTGAVYADSLSTATFALSMRIPKSASKYLSDTTNGEIRWYYKDTVGIKYTYALNSLKPSYQLQSLMAASEINKRYIAKLEYKLNLFLGLIAFLILLVIVVIVKKK